MCFQFASIENTSFTEGNFSYDDLNSKNSVISKLESDQCKSLHATNGAVTIMINKILLLSIIIFIIII